MTGSSRIRSRGSIVGCMGAVVLVSLCVFSFLNFVEVVKYAGVPFLLIPDALGLVKTVGRDEVTKVSLPNRTTTEIEIAQPGDYLVYLPTWEQSGEITSVSISNTDGRVNLAPVERPTMPFDTISANGFPQYMFTINQPGKYKIRLTNPSETGQNELSVTIVPDYITGNETLFASVMGFQFLLIVLVILAIIITRNLGKRSAVEAEIDRQLAKRDEMDEFISGLKGKEK